MRFVNVTVQYSDSKSAEVSVRSRYVRLANHSMVAEVYLSELDEWKEKLRILNKILRRYMVK